MNQWQTLVNLQQRSNKPWYTIKALGKGAEILLYDEIGFMGVTAQDFVKELQDVSGDITLRINSKGGDVFDGIAIYQALKNHGGRVNVFVDSVAASAASFIAMAGDHITMGRNANMMIHDGQGVALGTAADMRETAELLDKASNNIADIYVQRAGGTVEEWRTKMQAETWFNAQEAVDAGLADEVQTETTKSVGNELTARKTGIQLPQDITAIFKEAFGD